MLQMQVHCGSLPISPGATLAWLGFTEETLLVSYDSEVTTAHTPDTISVADAEAM